MFSKEAGKLKSFLGTQSELQGDLKAHGVLRLDGAVSGKVLADEVILSATAFIKGDIVAKRIIVSGKVEGSLRAADLVEIQSNGSVNGEIFTDKLLVMEGGQFNGHIQMHSDKAKILDFESRNQEASLKS